MGNGHVDTLCEVCLKCNFWTLHFTSTHSMINADHEVAKTVRGTLF